MNESELINEPVSFPVAGVDTPFRRLGSLKFRAIGQTVYVEGLARDIRAKAVAFDEDKRHDYIVNALAAIPSGDELAKIVDGQSVSAEMILRLVAESAGVDRDEAERITNDSTNDEFAAIAGFLMGKKKSTSRRQSGGGSRVNSRKSTATRPAKSRK